MKKTNSEQWSLILGSLVIQSGLLFIYNIFDDTIPVFGILLFVLMIYSISWIILKVDFISKIVLSKFVKWTTGILLFILLIGFIDKEGFLEGILLSLWIAMFFATFFMIAEEELRVWYPPKKSSPPSSPLEPFKPDPIPTEHEEGYTEMFVECVNCGTTHTDPINSLCSSCGKNMYKEDTNIKCANCGGEYSSSESSCSYCGSAN